MHILDHVGLNVADYTCSKAFYAQALAPLGIKLWMVLDPDGHNVEAVIHGG